MRKIDMPTKIAFERYGSSWEAFLINPETDTVPPDDYTDEDWNIRPEYEGEYIWLADIDDIRREGDPLLAKTDCILFECWYNETLYRNWGYHCPAAGHGLTALGGEPDFYAIDEDGEKRYFALD